MNGEENFKTRKDTKSGIFSINNSEGIKVIYAMPKGEFELACFQDTILTKKLIQNYLVFQKTTVFQEKTEVLSGHHQNTRMLK
jgi:hypothetical protein